MTEKKATTAITNDAPALMISPGAIVEPANRPPPVSQTPSIGRNVHYMWGTTHCAAIITNDKENEYAKGKWNQMLVVFPRNEPPTNVVAQYDPDCANGTWHWLEYVA